MKKIKFPITPAVRFLRQHKIPVHPHLYPYEEKGGAMQAAAELDIPPRSVIKTLVFDTPPKNAVLVLMHGDREVSARGLGRALGAKRVSPSEVDEAEKRTGYKVGGISPFGTRQALPVFVQASVLDLDRIYINGGKRGFLLEIHPHVLTQTLGATPVRVAVGKEAE